MKSRALWVTLWILWTTPAWAGLTNSDTGAVPQKICDENDPEKCVQPVHRGQRAPFTGQLLTNTLAIDLGIKADKCDDRLKLRIKQMGEILDMKLVQQKKLHGIDLVVKDETIRILRTAIDDIRPSFFESPVFVAIVTALATGAMMLMVASFGPDS